ncbi:MAG: hypothetical protein QG597_2064 [Actinomycetota bacterium]|nr:hypothetical protein [Actinomycetota bacterium]
MASAYPGAVDALVRPDGTDPLSDGHAALHNATSDAVEAVQTELGVNPSGSALTVAARFTAAESATADAQADATTALADAATADGKAVTAQATADAAVSKATYDAHSVLAATIDDTPAAVTVAEQTLLGRKTGGNIAALTVAEGKTLLGLGTAAVVDVPASGDATSGQAVKGSDSRLSDARTPTAHKTSHQSGGSDEVTLAQSQVTDLTSDLGLKAPLASPTLTGVPAAPTAAVDTNTTQVATTAFTVAQIADDAVAKSAVGNLLIANLANGSESGSVAADDSVDCSVASSTAQAKSGTRSIAQTAAAAYCYARMTDVTGFTAGQTYTFSAQARANASGETAEVTVLWRDSGGAGIGSVVSVNAAVVSTGWTRLINTTVAPAGAVTATIYLGKSGANGTVLYWDELGAWEGAGGQWALPGTPITNLGFYTDESVGRRLFQWDANNSRWQQTFGDTGWRDVTSLVNVSGWTNAPTALAVYVRRTLEHTSMIVQWNAGTGSCSGTGVLTLPSGFGPAATIIAPAGALVGLDGSTVGGWYWATGTTMNLTSPATSVVARTIVTLPCTAAWPTTLPGTASGSIPA